MRCVWNTRRAHVSPRRISLERQIDGEKKKEMNATLQTCFNQSQSNGYAKSSLMRLYLSREVPGAAIKLLLKINKYINEVKADCSQGHAVLVSKIAMECLSV